MKKRIEGVTYKTAPQVSERARCYGCVACDNVQREIDNLSMFNPHESLCFKLGDTCIDKGCIWVVDEGGAK